MTNTQRFIELAIEGGNIDPTPDRAWEHLSRFEQQATVNYMLLRPEAWQAVGKVKGWEMKTRKVFEGLDVRVKGSWSWKWHGFLDLLEAGRSIEEALGEIL